MKLRTLLLVGLATVAAVLVVVSVVLTLTTRNQLLASVDSRLESFAPDGRGRLLERLPARRDGRGTQAPAIPDRVSDVYEGVVRADGSLTTWYAPNTSQEFGAPALDSEDLPSSGRRFFTASSESGDVTYRVLAQRAANRTFITALPIDDVQTTIRRLVLVELMGSGAILAALAILAWWVIHLGIRPVKEMTETATRIAEGDLAVRVPDAVSGTETGDLAVALNRMLGQIGGAMDERSASEARVRRFVADASHELRTPVTTIRGYAELYRQGGLNDPTSLDDAMRRTEQEAVRMQRLVEDMLVLAKLDEQRPLDLDVVDLATLARDARADAVASSPQRQIDLDIGPGETVVMGDDDRLRQVIANVVANAIVHTDPDVPIEMRVRSSVDMVTLEVRDHGEGMTPDVAERATERLYRADPARARHRGGSGLGLSIVDATVKAHGGTLAISSRPGQGTTVTLTFPASPT